MNDLTTAAVERLTAQLGEALFGEPGLSLMEMANRRAEIEALVRDAGRYRWLRVDRAASAIPRVWSSDEGAYPVTPLHLESLDEAIDAAMEEQAE